MFSATLAGNGGFSVVPAVAISNYATKASLHSSAVAFGSSFRGVSLPSKPRRFPSQLVLASARPVAATVKAVAVLRGSGRVEGVADFIQKAGGPTTVTVRVTGLTPGRHGFTIHEYGDLTEGRVSTGEHFNPNVFMIHGAPTDCVRHAGDLGNIEANADGVAEATIIGHQIALSGPFSIVGRAIVVHEHEDDLGRGGHELSSTTGNSGEGLAFGVVGLAPP